jgi:hypothetical protein
MRATALTFGILIAAAAVSAQSQGPALTASIKPLGIWCDGEATLVIGIRNDGRPDVRWLGIRQTSDGDIPWIIPSSYSVEHGRPIGTSHVDFGGTFGNPSPASGIPLGPGVEINVTSEVKLRPRPLLPDSPFTIGFANLSA